MQRITQKSATASEALVNGISSIMYTFQGFDLEDFYGSNIKEPMSCSQFFGMAGLVAHVNTELKKASKRKR